ncbi:hypothetical protein DIURU_005010 [Diutina rugosa]|uniref:Uncharacterized protein n=1 Tax=Diutina rugosa TaxID=5481 RepID=A0A642UMP9_DIURU|nr:uncharacterized protein DIURU_005010 [Diutina rugosa]KAA8898155.1 hypothetical protein DIURU_005010 [Diutina rugosa]
MIVRISENVDGGYLAPFGTYKSNLNYSTDVVRDLIIHRQLAPFYTPLQDYDPSWSDEELLIIVSQLPLHSIDLAYSEDEEDDIDNHKIHKSQNYYRRQESKAKLKALKERVKQLQRQEEAMMDEEKLKWRQKLAGDTSVRVSEDVPNPDLMLTLYRRSGECPICFLYYPFPLNISRCCIQPIFTECFVQIRRLDPHPPHDDPAGQDETPHSLISEPANCPYCASPEFGVTYHPPTDISVGIGGRCKPGRFSKTTTGGDECAVASDDDSGHGSSTASPPAGSYGKRRESLSANAPGVITIDTIRPDWEQKLTSARSKLARKAATATAIHASNLLINDSGRGSSSSRQQNLVSVEERMIEEAMRLSIIDEEERKRKQQVKK